MMKNIFTKIAQHKIYTGVFAVLIIGGGWLGYKSLSPVTAATQYITAPAEKGVLAVSVSGSGQVTNSNKIDIKAQGSGKILSLSAVNGQEVKENQVLIQIDAKDAYKTVRDAQIGYQSALLALQKLTQPADSFSQIQAKNALDNAKNILEKLKSSQVLDYQNLLDAQQKAKDNVTKGYEDSFNSVSDAYLQLPGIMSGLDEILYSEEISKAEPSVSSSGSNWNALSNSSVSDSFAFKVLINSSLNDYEAARLKYVQGFADYKNASRYSSQDVVDSLLNETVDVTKGVAQAAKSVSNLLAGWVDDRTSRDLPIFKEVSDYQAQMSNYIGQVNSHLTALLSAQRSLQDNKDAITNADSQLRQMNVNNPLDLSAAEQSVKQQEASMQKLQAGADQLDIKSQQISLQQRVNSLNDARETLADYTIRSPFDGILAQVNVNPKDTVASGTVVATVITKQQVADISLNEVDVAKIKAGQKVNITFDAVSDMSLSGSVASIDGVGTVTQGVVNYVVHIIFDTQDDRIKPGMSVSAHIITDMNTDVIIVPNAAVKTRSGNSYVQVMENGVPREQTVELGLSNYTNTEILSGLKEGDLVVTQTITATKTSAATQQSGNLLQSLTGGGNRQLGGAGAGGNRQFGGTSAGR